MRLKTILVILLAVSGVWAQESSSPKPLSKENILQLLKSDVPSERLADLVERHGIDFEPTADILDAFPKAGAKDDLINALGTAKRVGAGGKPAGSPEMAARVKEHLDRAEQMGINGDHEGVISEGRRAVQIDSRNSEAHATLAVGFLLKGDYETALNECHEAERLAPQSGIAVANCAWALYRSGKAEEAVEEMRRALVLAPSNPHVHFVAALGALQHGNTDGAIAECHKALELDPNNFGAHNTLAAALNWQHKYEEGALAVCHEVLRVIPNDAQAHIHAALGIAE
jgi:tetratricopeptide (TPR) repeat protein